MHTYNDRNRKRWQNRGRTLVILYFRWWILSHFHMDWSLAGISVILYSFSQIVCTVTKHQRFGHHDWGPSSHWSLPYPWDISHLVFPTLFWSQCLHYVLAFPECNHDNQLVILLFRPLKDNGHVPVVLLTVFTNRKPVSSNEYSWCPFGTSWLATAVSMIFRLTGVHCGNIQIHAKLFNTKSIIHI